MDAGAAQLSDVCAVHYAPTQVNATFAPVQEVTVCAVFRHHYHHRHGLPFSPDMDVAHPDCWLYFGSAPLHTHLLEYHQGTWHDIHLIAYSPHSPLRTKKQTRIAVICTTQRCAPSCTTTGLWWKKSQTSTLFKDKHFIKHKLCCHRFTKSQNFHFSSFSASLLQPVATCSFIFALLYFCRRCTFTTRTPPTSSLPATRPAGAPGSITVSARLPVVDVSSSWLRSTFVEMK